MRRATHTLMLSTRDLSDGGSHPFGRVRLRNRGFLYRVCLLRLLRLIARLPSSASLIAYPRCDSSAAHMTSPDTSLTIAMPVVFEPGSILTLSGCNVGLCASCFRMIVNGYLRKTAAFPLESRMRARPGCTGLSGCLLVSSTNTLLNMSLLLLG